MHRIACIDIPSFALQLLALREPLWLEHPVAVVTEEKPSGIVLEINRKAKDGGVKAGMRFSAALTLAADLHAAAVGNKEIEDGVQTVLEVLLGYSPEIEPFELCPGVFWVNASGFTRLYTTLASWAAELLGGLKEHGFVARVSIGFSRFGSFLGAKRSGHPLIFKDPEEESRFSRYTPLTLLPMSPKAANQLKDLGVQTVGAFLDLPLGGVRKRFKEDVCRWYRFAAEKDTYPVQPHIPREELILTKTFHPEVRSIKPVLLHMKRLLDHLLTDVMKHNEFVHTLHVGLLLENGGEIREEVSPSRPTVRPDSLFRLLELRLSNVKIESDISHIEISADRVKQRGSQELLFNDHHARDLSAGAEAFALLRAELGNNAVQYAKVLDEHLPEKRIEWVNCPAPSVVRSSTTAAGNGPADDHGGVDSRVPATGSRNGGRAGRAINGVASTGNDRAADRVAATGKHHGGGAAGGTTNVDHRATTPQLVRRLYLSCTEVKRRPTIPHSEMQQIAGPVRYDVEWWDDEALRDYYYLQDRTGAIHWAYKNRKNGAWGFQGFVS